MVSLPMAGGVEQNYLYSPFQLKMFYDSVNLYTVLAVWCFHFREEKILYIFFFLFFNKKFVQISLLICPVILPSNYLLPLRIPMPSVFFLLQDSSIFWLFIYFFFTVAYRHFLFFILILTQKITRKWLYIIQSQTGW